MVTNRSGDDAHSIVDGDAESVEIGRLLRTAAYYERLGCLSVAASLRALAEARLARAKSGADAAGRGGAGGADEPT